MTSEDGRYWAKEGLEGLGITAFHRDPVEGVTLQMTKPTSPYDPSPLGP